MLPNRIQNRQDQTLFVLKFNKKAANYSFSDEIFHVFNFFQLTLTYLFIIFSNHQFINRYSRPTFCRRHNIGVTSPAVYMR